MDRVHLTRYADVAAAFKDARLGHDRGIAVQVPYFGKFMNGVDPPLHTKLRNAASHLFIPRVVEELRDFTRKRADELLSKFSEGDLIEKFAGPLSLAVINRWIGIDLDYARFRRLSFALSRLVEEATPEVFAGAMAAAGELAPVVASSAFLRESELDEEERVATGMLLLVAGHETTVNLIGNGMLALLQHPQEVKDVPAAIEELLRWDAPGRIATRWALQDVQIGEHAIRQGQRVLLDVGRANRDPEQFPNPETLDLERRPKHLSFGLGIHYCLGAPLARLEAELAFQALLPHRWELVSFERQNRPSINGLEKLNLRRLS